MRTMSRVLLVILVLGLSWAAAAEDVELIVPIYDGSRLIYDDAFGFEELRIVVDEETTLALEGVLRRLWFEAPEGRSPLEIIRNYENALANMDGEILFITRDPQAIEIDEERFRDIFGENRNNRGLATNVMTQNSFPELMTEYLVGRLTTAEADVYVMIGVGRGHWAANQDNRTYFEIVTMETEPMDLGMITMDLLREGLRIQGRAAVYNIFFATGSSEITPESAEALAVIAAFLQEHPDNRYLVVGHTDNVGSYAMNLDLSEARANAVVAALVNEYGVPQEQLTAVGVGFAAPVMSNTTEEGRARNRRVEIVEK